MSLRPATPDAFMAYERDCADMEPCPWCGARWIPFPDGSGGERNHHVLSFPCPFWTWLMEADVDTCPEHGRQEVVRYGATPGPDPYETMTLACGDTIACFGPGEPNVIL